MSVHLYQKPAPRDARPKSAGLVGEWFDDVDKPMKRLTIASVFGMAPVPAGYLLRQAGRGSTPAAAGSLALTLFALATVLPEYTVDVYLTWQDNGPATLGGQSLTLAGVTGANRLLVGLAWPLVILLFWVRSGGERLRLDWSQHTALWFLLLAALYAFTIYLREVLSMLDTLFLLLLFGGYMWATSRGQTTAPETDGAAMATPGAEASRRLTVALGAMACLAVATPIVAVPFAQAVVATSPPTGADHFIRVQWLVSMASKLPLLVLLSVLVWNARSVQVTWVLITSQIAQLTILLGSLPLASLAHGITLGEGGSLALDDHQRSELLLISAQSVFIVVVLAKMTVSLKGALALLGFFLLQAAMSAMQLGGQWTAVQTPLAAVFLGAAVAVVYRDRARLQALLTAVPARVGQKRRWDSRDFTAAR